MKKAFNIATVVIITVTTVILGAFVFGSSYLRLWETLQDFGLSVAYYFSLIFKGESNITPTVNGFSNIFKASGYLPTTAEEYKQQIAKFFTAFISRDSLFSWLAGLNNIAVKVSKSFVLLFPCIIALWVITKRIYSATNTKHGKNTVPLKVFLFISNKVFLPVYRLIQGLIDFIKPKKYIWITWLIMWLLNLNLVSIIVAFLAFYFYFAISFDIPGVFIQIAKLIIDLQVVFKTIPPWVFVIAGLIIWDKARKSRALNKLKHFEARNCGFINELPIVSMSCGSMGKRKTTLITDMALSQEVMFRQEALKRLQIADMKFPYFPWILFEDEIKICMRYRVIYNLATIKTWVGKKRKRYEKHKNSDLQLYGYDTGKYPITYGNGLYKEDIFDVLSTHAMLYFIYVIESSLIVSNYSVRETYEQISLGNFPLWNLSFFGNETDGRFSHILDFDTLRLGRKVIENNKNTGSFEFGIILITEIGKERCNNLELKEVKKVTFETNQKNDLFNSWLKMCRHSAMVDSFPFIKVFTDEQRPESWGSDARDLCDIIHIRDCSEQYISLPFYTLEEMFIERVYMWFIDLYGDFRFKRGDNTLLIYAFKKVAAWLYKRNAVNYNLYGYSILKIEKERGTQDGKKKKQKYYLCDRKIYNRRFSTDCFSDYFNEQARKTKVGLNDYAEYSAVKATVTELKQQNSYFINSLYKCDGEEDKQD